MREVSGHDGAPEVQRVKVRGRAVDMMSALMDRSECANSLTELPAAVGPSPRCVAPLRAPEECDSYRAASKPVVLNLPTTATP